MSEEIGLSSCFVRSGFAGGCAESGSAGVGISTPAGETSVELDDLPVNPSVNGWSHSGTSVSTCSSWSPAARVCFRSPRELGSGARLLAHAWDNQGNVVVGLTFDYSPFLGETWWLTWMPIVWITVFFVHFSKRWYRGCFFQKLNLKTNRHVQIKDIFRCFCCFMDRPILEVIIKDGSFDMEWFLALLESNHFYSSYEVKLLNPQLDSLPFEVLTGGDATVLPDSVWRTVLDSQSTSLVFCSHSGLKSKLIDVLAILHTVHSMDLPRMLERLDFADFRILWGWLQVCVPIFPFFSLNVHVREMLESHSELCLVIPLYFLQLHLAFIIRWNVNCNRCRISLVHQQI